MTEQQITKRAKKQNTGVVLNERFVHRDNIIQADHLMFMAEPDDIIARLAEHFALNETALSSLPEGAPDAVPTIDDMPRFQHSIRDGLQVPKEGKDGTGN